MSTPDFRTEGLYRSSIWYESHEQFDVVGVSMELPDGAPVPAGHLTTLLLSAMDALEQRERELDQRELESQWGVPKRPTNTAENAENRTATQPAEQPHPSLDELMDRDELLDRDELPNDDNSGLDDFLFDASDASDTDPDADDDVR